MIAIIAIIDVLITIIMIVIVIIVVIVTESPFEVEFYPEPWSLHRTYFP